MASFELFGFDGLQDALQRISDIPWEVTEKALNGMAEAAIKEIKAQGENLNVRDPESNTHILDKLKARKAVKTDYGGLENIDFSGTRTRHNTKTANATIAFENEYGNRNQKARPFVGLAMSEGEDKIYAPAEKIIGDWIESEYSRE